MTDSEALLSIGFILAIVLDLITVSAKAGAAGANTTRLAAENPMTDERLSRTIRLLEPAQIVRTRASLHAALALFRFFAVGFALVLFVDWKYEGNLLLRAVSVLLISALFLALLEWLAEENASRSPDSTVLRLSGFMRFLVIVLYPLVALTIGLFPRKNGTVNETSPITESGLKNIVDVSQQEGVIQQGERKMINSIFQLGNRVAREIMIPRIDITALDVQLPLKDAVGLLLKSGFSRVPVYSDNIDHILGVLYSKDLLRLWKSGEEIASVRSLLRPAYFIPEAKNVVELLSEMQARRVHMAIIVDEYGGVAGVATLEDIVEEIVGEIHDEFDQAEELPYMEIGKNEYIFQGRIDLHDFNEVMSSALPTEEAETLGGYIYNHFGRVPGSSETVQVGNLMLTVEQVSGRRIRKVRAQWLEDGPSEGEGQNNGNR
ncbi:MAG: HlyC/CorC family transporter [Chloroflexi bacterium]|nr:MAG: HlyC/CorC family transporter [Chloroflexota bacterium]